MKTLSRVRYIEFDYLMKRKLKNKEVITAEWLMESDTYCDITFFFEEYNKGFVLNYVLDNATDDCIAFCDLNENAKIGYRVGLKSLTQGRIDGLVAV